MMHVAHRWCGSLLFAAPLVVSCSPDSSYDRHLFRCIGYLDSGRYVDALSSASVAIADDPASWNAYYFRAVASVRVQDFDGAKRDLLSARGATPRSGTRHLVSEKDIIAQLGLVERRLGDLDSSLEAFESAGLYPIDFARVGGPSCGPAMTMAAQGRVAEAERVFASLRDFSDPTARFRGGCGAAWLTLRFKDPSQASRVLAKARFDQLNEKHRRTLDAVQKYLETNETERARVALEDAIENDMW